MKTQFRKKTSKKKASAGGDSPLMAGPDASAVDPRDLRRKERDERRKERAERKAVPNPARTRPALDLGAQSTKKSMPKISRKEQDAKDSELGYFHRFGTLLVKLLHVVDALIGLTFVVYGSLIMTQFEQPAMDAAITTLTYGSIVLFVSIMGVVGFYSPRCKRIGLLVSAYSSPLVVIFYMFAIVVELSSTSSLFDYLTEHMGVLYLNEAEITTLKHMLPVITIVLASLTAVEICR